MTSDQTGRGIAEAVADPTIDASVDGGRRRRARRAGRARFLYPDGLVDYVKHLNATKDAVHRRSSRSRRPTTTSGMSLEVAMQWNTSFTESVHTFANTINTHEGGTHEEGFRAALTTTVNNWAEELGADQEEGGPAFRRRRPRGPDRDHLDQAGRAAVRGSDQDQARQHRGPVVRPAGRQRPVRGVVRAEPRRGTKIIRKGMRPRLPGSRLARLATWRVTARVCSVVT